ncbi:hypothetical protein KM043_002335 [Ampulex compressa]|nr:hypothetical protein KM043_002335 [Ampulex compressa]
MANTYTDAGQLMCILCKSVVRNETVWTVHLNSKTHKENIALAKRGKSEAENAPKPVAPVFKRPPSPHQEATANKKIKGILKKSVLQSADASANLPADFFDSAAKQPVSGITSIPSATMHKLENNVDSVNNIESKTMEVDEGKEKGKDGNQTVLPEGFFDDPVMDAKVRNVEYKNPIEEEWEKFQKEIKEETAQSAQIIADDQEEATTERQLDEIEEQIRHWSRVMDLVKRKEEVQATDRKQESVDDDVSSGDETEFDEFLDWRAKNSYK